jgi:hypothetical protein
MRKAHAATEPRECAQLSPVARRRGAIGRPLGDARTASGRVALRDEAGPEHGSGRRADARAGDQDQRHAPPAGSAPDSLQPSRPRSHGKRHHGCCLSAERRHPVRRLHGARADLHPDPRRPPRFAGERDGPPATNPLAGQPRSRCRPRFSSGAAEPRARTVGLARVESQRVTTASSAVSFSARILR